MALSKTVVQEDRRLEQAAASTSEALLRHRWHWTLDESNPKRVSAAEYARAVGRNQSAITRDGRGYELIRHGTVAGVTEARERANMGAETEAATEAVANARGVGLQQARKTRPTEVRRVREIARQRAEDKGTTVEDEASKVADWIVKAEKADARHHEERTERLGLRFIEMEGELDGARRRLIKAVNLAHVVEWGDEERELLTSTLANVKTLLELINLALVGSSDVDWDAELAGLTED